MTGMLGFGKGLAVALRNACMQGAALTLGCALLAPPLVAQTPVPDPGLDPAKPISQYVQDIWTIDQGLPQNSVLAIVQGPHGYLWLGTESGLVRFDGVAFTTYTTANLDGLKDNYVSALMVDRDNQTWVGTWVGGVSRRSGSKWSAVGGAEGSIVNYLYQDRAGSVWAGQEAGLALLRDGKFHRVPGPEALVYTISETADGTLLAGTDDGLFAWRQGELVPWQPKGGKIEGTVWAIYRGRKGEMWFGTTDGLYRSSDGRLDRYAVKDGLPPGVVTAILETRNGQLWVGTDGGGIARSAGARFEQYASKDGLSDDAVTTLAEDREGSLWVGTRHGGLNRFREPILPIYTRREGLSANVVWSVYGDAQGIWVGTEGGGLNRFQDGRFTRYGTEDGLPSNTIFATTRTSDGIVWVATRGGLARLRGGIWKKAGKPFPRGRLSALTEDRSGGLWIGGDAGLYRWKDGRLHDFTREARIHGARVRTIVEDREGNLWIGTHGRGLVRLRDGRFTSFTTRDGLSNDVVESLFTDEHGLWVGTQVGLNLVRNGRIAVVPLSPNLFMTDLFQILKDDLGNLWFSSNQGLASVRQRDLLEVAGGRGGPAEVHEMVALDGRRRIEFNGGSQNAGWKSPDGRLWFPSIKGLVVVDPAHLSSNRVPPPVHVERLLVDGHDIAFGEPVHLPPGGGSVELQYTATSLLIPERVKFRYRLEGYDDDWVDAGTRRVAYYTRVPGGQYRFRVIAANNDGVWNRNGAVLPFELGLHFYETWWFYTLCGIAFLAGVAALHRVRMRRVQRQAGDLALLVDERTGELQAEVVERRRAEERYRHLFDANPQPVWVSDRDSLAFLAVNDSAVRHYGYSREEFFAMHLGDLQPPEQGDALPEWIRAAGDGWRGTSTWHHRKKDGSTIEVEVAAYAFTFAERPAALIVATDVTARRDLEERLRQAQKMEAVGQLAGGVAHDLNNVLTAVMAHVDLAVTTLSPDDAVRGDLTQAQAAAHRGATMIRKLLGFSRRERLVLKPLRLEELVGELALTLRRMLRDDIEIEVTRGDELLPVAADAGAVQQMILNLATNARDAMADGGLLRIHIGLATPADRLLAATEWGTPGHYVVLSMSDNGIGMDAEVVSRIFEPYFTTKTPEQGTGLGMAMVYGLMKQHLGYVLVNSEPGLGTEVRLYFPASAETVPAAVAEVAQTRRQGDQTILVVEDQDAVRSAATRALSRFGYRVLSAADGEEGLRLWRANADAIDLIVSDAIMPRMGGLALYEAVNRERPGVRFLLTSGYTGEEVRKSAPSAVDVPFLPKPWTVNELLAAMREVLMRA